MRTDEMLQAFPGTIGVDQSLLARAIDSLTACAQTCTACADACLSEESVAELRSCITTDLDCADICATTARVLSRNTVINTEVTRSLLRACVESCRVCGEECAQHADHHDHCRICAEACGECERACQELLDSMS